MAYISFLIEFFLKTSMKQHITVMTFEVLTPFFTQKPQFFEIIKISTVIKPSEHHLR